ncbi:MAG: hypothetical protein KBC12_02540 [Candidatus Pacebacteria bacterium]|nr:hypothetical protein [Candidatus Paceibacterota bacterium]
MEILSKLIGSPARIKIMRLFLQNKDTVFLPKDVSSRSRVSSDVLRRELKLLQSVGFLKKNTKGYFFNIAFKYTREFETLLVGSDTMDETSIAESFKKVGKTKLLIVSGFFIKNKDSRIDLLIVGDSLQKGKIEEAVKKLESEIGTELTYATFDTNEFVYRLNMYDKLVRDILDFPHKVLIQTKDVSQTLVGLKKQ